MYMYMYVHVDLGTKRILAYCAETVECCCMCVKMHYYIYTSLLFSRIALGDTASISLQEKVHRSKYIAFCNSSQSATLCVL